MGNQSDSGGEKLLQKWRAPADLQRDPPLRIVSDSAFLAALVVQDWQSSPGTIDKVDGPRVER